MSNIDNNCDDNCNADNNLLGEVDLNTEIKIVNEYIGTNQEEHLNAIVKEETEEVTIPALKRCATYCAPKIEENQDHDQDQDQDKDQDQDQDKDQDQDQEDLPLPTLKKEPAYNIRKEFQTRLEEQRCAKWSHRMTGIVYPNDWLCMKMPETTSYVYGDKYVLKDT